MFGTIYALLRHERKYRAVHPCSGASYLAQGGSIVKRNQILTLNGAVIAAFVLNTGALADTSGSSAAHVYVTVAPNVSVGVLDSNLQLPDVQVGGITADVSFRVDSNEEAVTLGVATTALYKGGDPTNAAVAPLNVDQTIGATITAAHANPTQGASHVAQYNPTAIDFNGFIGFQTNDIPFESSQYRRFSQDVNVHVGWQQMNPEQPQGQYSGYVVLYTALLGVVD